MSDETGTAPPPTFFLPASFLFALLPGPPPHPRPLPLAASGGPGQAFRRSCVTRGSLSRTAGRSKEWWVFGV